MRTIPDHRPPSRPGLAAARAGFTLLEVTVFTAILLMGLSALTSTALTVNRLTRQNIERAAARSAIQAIAAEIQGVSNSLNGAAPSWSRAFVDTYSAGGSVGNQFPLASLEQQDGTPATCSIAVVVDERDDDDDVGYRLGLPRDLDNDGLVGTVDVSDTAQVLPVVATVTWNGVSGVQSITHGFYVMSY